MIKQFFIKNILRKKQKGFYPALLLFSSKNKSSAGFTLVELIIALALFVIVVTISLGSVLSIVDAGRKAQSIKEIMTNLNFAIDDMSREIKFGTSYYCGTDSSIPPALPALPPTSSCAVTPLTSITFTTSEGIRTNYRFCSAVNTPVGCVRGGVIEKSVVTSGAWGPYIGITSREIVIQGLSFYVLGTTPSDSYQPRVLMVIKGTAVQQGASQSTFTIQTTVSQRALDI
jgi:prepilin-type N-terminal cleavage/methylation domain-containing protein